MESGVVAFSFCPFSQALPLHVGNLGQQAVNEFTGAARDADQAVLSSGNEMLSGLPHSACKRRLRRYSASRSIGLLMA